MSPKKKTKQTKSANAGQKNKVESNAQPSATTSEAKVTSQTKKKVSKKKVAAKKNSTPPKQSAIVNQEERVVAPTQAASTVEQMPNSGRGLSWMALIFSLLGLAAGGYAAYQTSISGQVTGAQVSGFDDRLKLIVSDQQGLKASMSDLTSSMNSSVTELSNTTKTLAENVKAEVTDISERLVAVNSSFDELQTASQDSIDDVKANLGESVARWQLDEVHALLGRANQFYLASGDKNRALSGYKLAQTTLQTIDNSKLTAVKSALAEDILQLKASKMVDVATLHDRLASISKLVPELALMEDSFLQTNQEPQSASEESEPKESENGASTDENVIQSLLGDLGALVKHKNLDAPLKPSLDESTRFSLYRSIQLNLQAAMVSLLTHNNAIFQNQLKQADGTINAYFDVQSDAVKSVTAELSSLAGEDISLNTKPTDKALLALSRLLSLEN